jgi:hypothetical protein
VLRQWKADQAMSASVPFNGAALAEPPVRIQDGVDMSHDWDETPAEAARYDRRWGDRDINRDED